MKTKFLLLGVALIAVGAYAPSNAATIVVTPSSMGNWSFDNRDSNGIVGANPTGNGAMVSGPASPPLGTGSANLATGNGTIGGDGAEELRNTGYAGTLLSSITALSYSTYMTLNNGQQFPYFGLMISTTGGTTPDDIIFFEPPYQTHATGNPGLPDQGPTAMNTWQTWDALAGGWWDDNNLCTPGTGVESLSACLGAAFATTTIVNTEGGLGGIRFDVGFASPDDQFNGYVDNFTIGVNGANTTYDFDPNSASVPEPAIWATMLLGFFGVGFMLRRTRNTSALATV